MSGAGKSAAGDNGVTEFQFYQPDNKTAWERFQTAIYDKSTNQILGRTPKNWGQLLLFYSIFYIVLAALFAICMQGLFATLDDKAPKWKLGSSLIGDNPGLGFRPISNETNDGSLIWYNVTNQTAINMWVNWTNEFLKPYQNNQSGENFEVCSFDKHPGPGKVCTSGIKDFGDCTPENSYGYNSHSPCVFLKLNRIYGWQPKFYKSPDPDMPSHLKEIISTIKDNNNSRELEQIWVTCNGIDAIDQEHIQGFSYNPPGFAGYYYPYTNEKNYLSPLVAVQIKNITPNVIVNIECRSWATNIKYVGGSLFRAGSVTFEIQIDSAKPETKVLSPVVRKNQETNTSSVPPQPTENVPVTSGQTTIENPVTQTTPATSVTN